MDESKPQTQAKWTRGLDPREQAQIAHARHYAGVFSASGVPGHGQFLLIAKLAQLLDDAEQHEGEMMSSAIESFDGPSVALE